MGERVLSRNEVIERLHWLEAGDDRGGSDILDHDAALRALIGRLAGALERIAQEDTGYEGEWEAGSYADHLREFARDSLSTERGPFDCREHRRWQDQGAVVSRPEIVAVPREQYDLLMDVVEAARGIMEWAQQPMTPTETRLRDALARVQEASTGRME